MNKLSQQTVKELLLYNPETGVLTWKTREIESFENVRCGKIWNARFAGKEAGCKRGDGYIVIGVLGEAYYAHRLVWLYLYGCFPKGMDHFDRDTSNNRSNNLREATSQQNSHNLKLYSTNTSGVCGVSWSKRDKIWRAYIKLNNKQKALGSFGDLPDAVCARRTAEKRYGFNPNHGKENCL